jgi:hypothetical protein
LGNSNFLLERGFDRLFVGLIIHDGSAFYTGKVGPLVDEAFLGGRVVADDLLNAVF